MAASSRQRRYHHGDINSIVDAAGARAGTRHQTSRLMVFQNTTAILLNNQVTRPRQAAAMPLTCRWSVGTN